MSKLIYHLPQNSKNMSPFDEVLVKIVENKEVKIACPFIEIYYINKLIKLSSDWKLLTDVNAWLYSQSSVEQRNKIYNFLLKHRDKVRHYPNLHAKVVIAEENLFLGSSNLTDSGIFRKNEMSIHVTDIDDIKEANCWYDAWWEVSSFPNEDELKKIIELNQQTIPSDKLAKVNSSSPKINTNAYIPNLKNKKEFEIDHASEIDIINYLKKWNDNEWEWDFFEHMKMAIEYTGLSRDDEYLTMTLTNSGSITLQVNNRYILNSHSKHHKINSIGLMLPIEFKEYIKEYQEEIYHIDSFSNRKSEVALWVIFKKDILAFDNRIYSLWKKAIQDEVKREYLSPFRKFNQPIIYDVTTDIEKRKELFAYANE